MYGTKIARLGEKHKNMRKNILIDGYKQFDIIKDCRKVSKENWKI